MPSEARPITRAPGRAGQPFAAMIAAVAVLAGAGCDEPCCRFDSYPIALDRAPMGGDVDPARPGALVARAARSDGPEAGQPFDMVVDTGSPLTLFARPPDVEGVTASLSSFELLDPANPSAVRAELNGIQVVTTALGPIGDPSHPVGGIFGADLMRAFSIEMRLGTPSTMTVWPHLGAGDGFLQEAGYAVLHVQAYGGGETKIQGQADWFGLRAPITLSPTRIVARACVAPEAFSSDDATDPRAQCCVANDALEKATGVSMALLVSTGIGPMVLGRSAWTRVAAYLQGRGAPPPPETSAPLYIPASATPIAAGWSRIPRFALVDLEAGTEADPGPCVELARSRRIEWVERRQQAPDATECFAPCDADARQRAKAQNSAAYFESRGDIPVAIIADEESYLQGLRFDVRPEGPDVDGIVGAGALGPARLEIDYRTTPVRAILSCDGDNPELCKAAPRCPRLPNQESEHSCFGFARHPLPTTCAPTPGC